jgi:branched-chain amino acid transport system ATP-binding protein
VLEISDLHVAYGGILALRGVSLRIDEGEVVALIGANGAGKSTLLNAIAGAARPSAGGIAFDGQPLTALPGHERAALGLVLIPEGRAVLRRMTVEENLLMGAHLRRDADVAHDMRRMFERFPILAARHRQPAGLLSGGEQQMLAIARALMARPRLLMMDEPSLGLTPRLVREVFGMITALRDEGLTVLLVEQNAHEALRVARRGYVMETGRIVLAGASEELRADPRVQAAYLGSSFA